MKEKCRLLTEWLKFCWGDVIDLNKNWKYYFASSLRFYLYLFSQKISFQDAINFHSNVLDLQMKSPVIAIDEGRKSEEELFQIVEKSIPTYPSLVISVPVSLMQTNLWYLF